MLRAWGFVHGVASVLAFIVKEYNWGLYFGIISIICFIGRVTEVRYKKSRH